ncbi:MAG: glycosyltransferase family 39 protein [Candidatus Eremiobacteraeota bacterium]|nr:glycosyltransferase family 39 protein [Candidatus Eremiobacteraeota bacterium]
MNVRTTPWIAAAVVFLVHALGNAHYGFFRDELYFIMCGFHPQWGYVDQPPLVPLMAAATQLFGHSLWLLRAVPAVFAAAAAYTTCLLVAEFGGGMFAQALATLVFLFTGVLMSFGAKVSTDEVNLFTWPLLAYLLVRIVKGADARLWIVAGAVAGITLESKYSVMFLLVALVAGLLLTPERRIMRSRWFAFGVATMAIIALPNFLWQAHYGFPMLELLRNGANGKNISVSPVVYLVQEIVITNLFLFPVWIAGLVWLLSSNAYRFLGYAYIILIAEMIVTHGKHYYPGAVYSILIAAGAVAIESLTSRMALSRYAVLAYALVLGPLFVPFALPILPENAFLAYQDRLGTALHLSRNITATEHHREDSAMPGDWADMHGWPEMAATVKRIYHDLPPAERVQAVVVASNYGEAAAVQFFAPGIPVISGHNQYWLWGPGGYSGNVVIDVNGDCGAKDHLFTDARRAAVFSSPFAIGYETNMPIMICRGIKVPLAELWPQKKEYI